MTGFLEAMDKLAAEIAERSCDTPGSNIEKVPLADKVDAFKALMPYYAFLKKNKDKDIDEDDDLPNFTNFTKQIHAKERVNGGNESGVHSRSRRNGHSGLSENDAD